MNNITHWEIPAKDVKKVQEFYSKLFDWQFEFMEQMNYWMFQTTNAQNVNAGTGGILKKESNEQSITNYINVQDLDEKTALIEKLGGKIIVPKSPVPGMGWMMHFQDVEGNLMALWQADKNAK